MAHKTTKLFALLLFSFCGFSQNNLQVAVNGHFGFIAAHHQGMRYLVRGHVAGAELNFGKKTTGENYWQQIYRFPEIGVSCFFAELGNPDELGNGFGIYPFISMPFNSREKFSAGVRIGAGLGYLTKHFNRLENHKNTAIGTGLNGFFSFRFFTNLKFSEHFRMESGIGLTHFSNGAFKTPNLGINIPTVNLGLCYLPGFQKKEIAPIKDSLDKKIHFMISASMGITEILPVGGKKYPVLTTSLIALKNITPKSRLTLGAELFYNSAVQTQLAKDTINLSAAEANFLSGFTAGWELVIGNFSMPVNMGVYVHSKATYNGIFYHRIGARYKLSKKLTANILLKSHWAKAECFEFGIGYLLN